MPRAFRQWTTLQERAIDIVDLSDRILANILYEANGKKVTEKTITEASILVADEVSAPMLAEFQEVS